MIDLGPLQRALAEQDRNIAEAAAFLSPEREAERRQQFETQMAELAACRADLRAILNPPAPSTSFSTADGHHSAAIVEDRGNGGTR